MKQLLTLAAAALLAACVVAPVPAPNPTSAAATPKLAFTAGTLQLATAQTRGLGALLQDEKGQAPAPGAVGWVSLAPGVATVDADGTVHALTPGTATIVAALGANPAVRASVQVTVTANASTVQLDIVPAKADLAVGERVTLRGEVHLADGTVNGNVTWSTSDGTILAINPTTGEVNGLKAGKATIVGAYTQDQSIRGTAEIQVYADAASKPNAAPSATVFRGGDLGDGFSRATISADASPRTFAFANPNVGIAATNDGRLYGTISGGASWDKLAGAGILGEGLFDLAMPDETTVYASADNKVFKSLDAGASWTVSRTFTDPVDAKNSATIVQLAFSSAASGYALTASGVLFRTTDGGANWGLVKTPEGLFFDGLALAGSKPWLLTQGEVYGYEGGAWVPGAVTIVRPTRAHVSFVDAQQGFALTSAGLQATQDGGKTWAPQGKQGGGEHLAFGDALHGVVATTSNVAYTADGGKTWKNKGLDNFTVTQVRAAGPHDFFLLGHAIPHTNQPEAVMFHYDGR